jgi:hypothetical protein
MEHALNETRWRFVIQHRRIANEEFWTNLYGEGLSKITLQETPTPVDVNSVDMTSDWQDVKSVDY